MGLISGKSKVIVLEPWGQYNSIRSWELLWVSNERVSSCGQLHILLLELVIDRTSECPRPNEKGGKTKPDQRGHVVKLFF
jgi:hypothetical protein